MPRCLAHQCRSSATKWRRRHSGGAIPYQRPDLVPVAVDRPVEVSIEVMSVGIAEHRAAMAHAHRLEAVPEAAGFGRLHESHTGERRGHNRSKNKPHEVTSFGYTLSDNTMRQPLNLIQSGGMQQFSFCLSLVGIVQD